MLLPSAALQNQTSAFFLTIYFQTSNLSGDPSRLDLEPYQFRSSVIMPGDTQTAEQQAKKEQDDKKAKIELNNALMNDPKAMQMMQAAGKSSQKKRER
jgi:hypothetical protein